MPDPLQPPTSGEPISLPAFGIIEPERLAAVDELFAVVKDKFPVSPGHTLIIPRREVIGFSKLTSEETAGLLQRVQQVQQHLNEILSPAPDGFNLGINDGPAAGQTISQFHFHVIPRYKDDVSEPRGGIRWVIPEKATYW